MFLIKRCLNSHCRAVLLLVTYHQGQQDLNTDIRWRWMMIWSTQTFPTLTQPPWLNTHPFFKQAPHKWITLTVKHNKYSLKKEGGNRVEGVVQMTYLPHCYSWFLSRPLIMFQSGSQEWACVKRFSMFNKKTSPFQDKSVDSPQSTK